MAKINTQGLDHFAKRISLYKDSFTDSNKEQLIEKVAERGKELAEYYYGMYKNDDDIEVTIENAGTGSRRLVASGERVAYLEFGTGIMGYGTYEGKLPTQTLSFESPKGHPQTTQGWEYNYENPLTKADGKGWFFKGVYTRGQPAQAQMFETAQQLRREIADMTRKEIKK